MLTLAASMTIFACILWQPAKSVVRRLIGMIHDVAAISGAIYFGEAAGAAISIIYLWITLGNGFRYGAGYLYTCAALSIAGLSVVYFSSEYWQDQVTLSANTVLIMLVVPPYVGSLLRSLRAGKDQLQHRASFDSLTGLLSRVEIEAAVGSLFLGDHSGHILLFCDLDRFKEVNDIAGNAAGGKLLADVGQIIRDSVRRNVLSGRIGGDEFCVLLRDCSLEKGRETAEEIRSGTTGSRLAVAACYAAKNAGRNRVHVVDPRTDHLDTQKIRQLIDADAASRKHPTA